MTLTTRRSGTTAAPGGDRLWWAQLRYDPATGESNRIATGPLYEDPCYLTAALLVHQDSTRARIVYDLPSATEREIRSKIVASPCRDLILGEPGVDSRRFDADSAGRHSSMLGPPCSPLLDHPPGLSCPFGHDPLWVSFPGPRARRLGSGLSAGSSVLTGKSGIETPVHTPALVVSIGARLAHRPAPSLVGYDDLLVGAAR